ncbi:Alpha-ketoglutarate-dependent sulfonate dioxygenase [Madurella mycetomatis]|uniref:Alpha-ketoglutarate-dependent sulfonate dioxygenase n=1 Tax=Madurella mycetomatis TaxID=100816 RepID=A0A175W0I9_9PEZI|nr:Alpha-ketoglutarate-dependent sulfonate dioxygenase [Madurella mycetomatis]
MAPSAVEVQTITAPVSDVATLKIQASPSGPYKELAATKYDADAEAGLKGHKAAKVTRPVPLKKSQHPLTFAQSGQYPHYLPTWNRDERYPPLQLFEHYEHGKDADTSYPNLFPDGVAVTHLTPTIGTEVRGIQLSTLSPAGKDELARFVAERKVVAFRDQDFADLPIEQALEYGSYFGRHHIHPTSGAPAGYPEVHIVHRGAGDSSVDKFFANRTSSVAWHSDVSYEQQPPGTTFLYILDKPETGGDTVFVDGGEGHLSDVATTPPRRKVTRDIVGLKKEESDALLKFLYDHIAFGVDFQARVKWEERTVVVWDNRVTQHSALVDWKNGQRRHLARITPQAERPFETPFDG